MVQVLIAVFLLNTAAVAQNFSVDAVEVYHFQPYVVQSALNLEKNIGAKILVVKTGDAKATAIVTTGEVSQNPFRVESQNIIQLAELELSYQSSLADYSNKVYRVTRVSGEGLLNQDQTLNISGARKTPFFGVFTISDRHFYFVSYKEPLRPDETRVIFEVSKSLRCFPLLTR